MAASRSAHPAKLAKSHIIERGSETEDDSTASRLRTSLTGTSGFTLATNVRSRAVSSDGSAEDRTKSAIALGIWRLRATPCGYGMYRAPVISAGARPDRVYWRTSPTTPTTVRQSLSQTTRMRFPIGFSPAQ